MLKIAGAAVYDPRNGVRGEVRDLWIDQARFVAPPPAGTPCRTLDAAGLVAMPGGVDMHTHIVGGKVNAARKFRPEESRRAPVAGSRGEGAVGRRSGNAGSIPTTWTTGYLYSALGYTAAFDAAIAPLAARHAHEELDEIPCLDTGCFLLAGNNHFVLDSVRREDSDRLDAFLAWLLRSGHGYALKVVNPGGVENWKSQFGRNIRKIDDLVEGFGVSARDVLTGIAASAQRLGLPHPMHIHCNGLGLPGNWRTTLETLESLSGLPAHLTHVQFHSYGGGDADESTFSSKAAALVEYVNAHPEVTVDVGQVMFGPTTSMTGDGPLGHYLSELFRSKWISCDVECESGCGIVPMEYKRKDLVHGIQWAIGLEWYLLAKDPWRVAMSTDHPNGGVFSSYPQVIHLLMDRELRRETLAGLHPLVRERTCLADLDREYTLEEICIITRAAPAKILGLNHKGHLGPGADADLALYRPDANRARMFECPAYVFKSGEPLIENGDPRPAVFGSRLLVEPSFDPGREAEIAAWFKKGYSIEWEHYAVSPRS